MTMTAQPDREKTTEQLVQELAALRRQVAELEAAGGRADELLELPANPSS